MENTIKVPLSLIRSHSKALKTRNPKIKKTNSQTISVIKVPFLIKETCCASLTTKPPHPVGGLPHIGRGLLGIIQSHLISKDGSIPVKMVEASDVASRICSGENNMGDLVVLDDKGLYPAHVPDLSDLALLPPALKLEIRWALLNMGGAKGISLQHLIPSTIRNIIYPCSTLPAEVKSFTMSAGVHEMNVNSYSDDLKLLLTESHTQLNRICVSSAWLGRHFLYGRRATLHFSSTRGECNGKVKLLIWNCRDMGRESFLKELMQLVELQMPDIVLLTETRVSIHMAKFICQNMNWVSMHGTSHEGVVGGYALIVFSDTVKISADEAMKWRVSSKVV